MFVGDRKPVLPQKYKFSFLQNKFIFLALLCPGKGR